MFNVVEDDQARTLIDRAEAIDIVEAAYRGAAAGLADVSSPSALFMRGKTGSGTEFKIKGAILDSQNVAGFRLIADGVRTAQNASAYLYVANAETGQPLGMVSESWLHRLRTASTGLAACRALLPKNARTLALIGTGRIAEQFIRSCHLALPQVTIVLSSRSTERAQACAERWRKLTPYALTAAAVRDAVAGADVVVTVSDAKQCLFKASDVQPHALLVAMGGYHEFDSDLLHAADAFVVDEMDFVCTYGNATHWIKTGQTTRPDLERRLDATIGELLSGKKALSSGKRVLAILQGMAICDLALAKVVLDRVAAGHGTDVRAKAAAAGTA